MMKLARLGTLIVRLGRKLERHMMNMLLWVLQVLAALLYGSSGVMKVFMFDKVSQDVPSFGALPREAWMTLGILELVCTVGLIVPAAFHWQPRLTVLAATDPGGREPRVHRGARQVPRGHAHDLEWRAGSAHGVHRVWPDVSSADHVTGAELRFKGLAITAIV